MKEFQEKISTVSFWVVLGIGVIALAGWLGKELSLAGMGKNSIPMAPATIICFILISFSALNLKQNLINPKLLKAILLLVCFFSLIILFDALNRYPLNLERILGSSSESHYSFPIGRMSPITSILFLLGSTSLLFVSAKTIFKKIYIKIGRAHV